MSNVVSFEERFEEQFRMQAWADFERALNFCNEEEFLEALWIIETWLPVCQRRWLEWKRPEKETPPLFGWLPSWSPVEAKPSKSLVQHTALTIMNGMLELREFFRSEMDVAEHNALHEPPGNDSLSMLLRSALR